MIGTKGTTLKDGERVQRKLLITVVEWGGAWTKNQETSKIEYTGSGIQREILGTRTEDSSIEFNADTSTSTDIRGITYTDVNKTEPQQDFDPVYLIGGSKLSEYLVKAALTNDIDAYNNVFNAYIITAFISGGEESDTSPANSYYTVCHKGCSVIPTSLGGDSYNSMPIELHFSNDILEGTVDSLSDDFKFTEKA